MNIDNLYDGLCYDFQTPPTPFESCPAELGFTLNVAGPGAQGLYPSGHTISAVPSNPAQWSPPQGLLMSNTSTPSAVLSNAYLNAAGEVVGDADFVEARFTLTETIAPGDPKGHVLITDISATNSIPTGLDGEVQDGIIIVSDP